MFSLYERRGQVGNVCIVWTGVSAGLTLKEDIHADSGCKVHIRTCIDFDAKECLSASCGPSDRSLGRKIVVGRCR